MSSNNGCGIIRFFRYLNCCSPKRISIIITDESNEIHDIEYDKTNIKKGGKGKALLKAKSKGKSNGHNGPVHNAKVVPETPVFCKGKIIAQAPPLGTSAREYLNNIEYKDTIAFVPPIMYGKVIKVYDGDTITIAARLPFEGSPIYRFSVRLAGIDSPEVKGGSLNETELALKSRDALSLLIFGKVIELKNNGKEKYGRLLADLYLDNLHINKWMIDNMYAVPYGGGKKNRPTEWE